MACLAVHLRDLMLFVHKKTLGCCTDLLSKNRHFEFKAAATMLWLYLLPFSYQVITDFLKDEVRGLLGKKTLASEFNTSQCNSLSRK